MDIMQYLMKIETIIESADMQPMDAAASSEEIPVQDIITAIDGYGALRIAGDRAVKPVYLPLIPYEEPIERTFPDIPSVMAPYPGIARRRKAPYPAPLVG